PADDTYTRILGGSFVQCKGEQSDKASNLVMYTYDADRKCYRAWWFGSTGQTSESTGKWDADAKALTWTASAGEGLTATSTHRFVNDDTIEWSLAVKDKTGKLYFAMEAKSMRVKDSKK